MERARQAVGALALRLALALVAAASGAGVAAATSAALTAERAETGADQAAACRVVDDAAWRAATTTAFRDVTPNAHAVRNGAVTITSQMAASILSLAHAAPPRKGAVLSWRWSARGALNPADLSKIGADDRIGAVMVGFAPKLEAMSRWERLKRRLQTRIAGEAAPWRVIAYTWAGAQARAADVLRSPHLPEQHMIKVLRRGIDAGEQTASVDPFADYRTLFGAAPPPISSISILVDTDDTDSAIRLTLRDLCLPV
ncbi:MAG: DUF3047 domain-containing protein [Pseudomonadota bacterium]